ncbi:hypothetical protein [Novosphingobium sp.]|uniref:hypothetical protein n=1 Tax=Novosphingobium sp. TaxID=1874826 RepID=UPI0035B166D8
MKSRIWLALACASALSSPAFAQDHSGHDMGGMQHHPGMEMPQPQPDDDMAGMDHGDHAAITTCQPGTLGFVDGSGTSRLPGDEASYHERMMRSSCMAVITGDMPWMFMAHGTVSLQHTDHTGPRGASKTYATSMAMLGAERTTDWGRIQFKSMLSLEPAMDAAGYPNLFATGETAQGLPLVDRQHPHDLFMELSARVDLDVGDGSLFVYGGPVGEPALGPSAFMHRGSAALNPEPPITHHWFDSTHITYGVVTAGYSAPLWQLEASAFRGAEPDEKRWNIETPKLDSWSVRATLTPTPNWAIQASYGQIKQPEATHPGEDEHRFTTSAQYARGGVSAMLAYSAKKRVPGETLSAWIGEVNWDLDRHNTLFGRFENVANDELFPDHHDPLHDQKFRVSKFQTGYARRIPLGPVELALGGSVNLYAKPAALDPYYGDSPWGYTVFARITLGH